MAYHEYADGSRKHYNGHRLTTERETPMDYVVIPAEVVDAAWELIELTGEQAYQEFVDSLPEMSMDRYLIEIRTKIEQEKEVRNV